MKAVLAKKIVQVGQALFNELLKEAPDYVRAKDFVNEILIDANAIKVHLINEGAELNDIRE